jgi:cellulose synthase (UDP-forming)
LFFGEYWFTSGHRRQPFIFGLLSFALFWKPLRNLYNWWLYSWADTPKDCAESTSTFDTSVDIVTTAMPGEPYDMFVRTLNAIAVVDGLHGAFLLDGGNDPALKNLCRCLGITHVNCQGMPGAKAGKVNHCLRHHSNAEFVVVIDPDHVPQPDFIVRVLPYFSDPTVGFVQVVQAYYNLRENWVSWAAAEQTFGFYGPTLMGLHGLGLPTAIGANCTFRRSALDSVGGHAEHLAEDALTSMRIHANGWKSVYLPWRGSVGIVPTDLGSFWKQQLKWATGMTYLMVKHYPRLFRRFPVMAKLHYLLANTYYLCGVAAALNLVLPILFLFFQVYAVEMPLRSFLFHLAPYALISTTINLLVQRWYSHREEWGIPWRSMFLEHGTWHIYLVGFFYGLVGRKVPYLPTPKDADDYVSPSLFVPHLAIIALSLAAIAWVPLTYHRVDAGTTLMIGFCALNAAMLLPVSWTASRGWLRRKLHLVRATH